MLGVGGAALADLFGCLGGGEVHAVAAVDVDVHKAGGGIAACAVNDLNALFGFGQILLVNSCDLAVLHINGAVGIQLGRGDQIYIIKTGFHSFKSFLR